MKMDKEDIKGLAWAYVGCFLMTFLMIVDMYFGKDYSFPAMCISSLLFGAIFMRRDQRCKKIA